MISSVGEIVIYINDLINILACILLFYLINHHHSNTYKVILWYMNLSQFIFNLCHIIDDLWLHVDVNIDAIAEDIFLFPILTVYLPSGLASVMFILIILWILFYIVTFRSYVNADQLKFRFLYAVLIPNFLYAMYTLAVLLKFGYNSSHFEFVYILYQHIRLYLIILLFLFTISILYTISTTKIVTKYHRTHPIYLLLKKLFLYPVVQLICRIPYFLRLFFFPDSDILHFLSYMTIPLGGLGNFLVFLYGNNQSIRILKDLFLCRKTFVVDIPLNNNISFYINDVDRDSLMSDRDSINIYNDNEMFRNSINQLTFEEFKFTDDNGNIIDVENFNYDNLDEEQLVKHIAILRKNEIFIMKKDIELT